MRNNNPENMISIILNLLGLIITAVYERGKYATIDVSQNVQ